MASYIVCEVDSTGIDSPMVSFDDALVEDARDRAIAMAENCGPSATQLEVRRYVSDRSFETVWAR